MLSIIFCQSQSKQLIAAITNIPGFHIFLAKTTNGLVYDLRFRGRLVDDSHSLFR